MLRSTFNEITLVAKTSKVLYATVDRPERKLNLGGGFLTDKWEQIRHPGEHPSQAVWWWHGLSQHQLEQNAGNCWAFRSFLPQTLPGESFPVTLALSPLLEVAARDFSFKDRFVVIVLLLLFFKKPKTNPPSLKAMKVFRAGTQVYQSPLHTKFAVTVQNTFYPLALRLLEPGATLQQPWDLPLASVSRAVAGTGAPSFFLLGGATESCLILLWQLEFRLRFLKMSLHPSKNISFQST